MLSRLPQLIPATQLSALFVLSPTRAFAYATVAFFLFAVLWYMLWLLPIHAWFRKPIQLSAKCPLCGSKDFRPSHLHSAIDRVRSRLGLLPFRCRGCTKRFVSRATLDARSGLPWDAGANRVTERVT